MQAQKASSGPQGLETSPAKSPLLFHLRELRPNELIDTELCDSHRGLCRAQGARVSSYERRLMMVAMVLATTQLLQKLSLLHMEPSKMRMGFHS